MRVSTLLLGLCSLVAARAPLGPFHRELQYEQDEYIVQVASPQFLDEHIATLERHFVSTGDRFQQVMRRWNINKGDFVAFGARLTGEMVEKISEMEGVVRIEPNAYLSIYGSQKNPPNWGIDRMDQRTLPLNNLYLYSDKAGEGVDAYIIDTGVNTDHVEFAAGNAKWGTTTPRNSEDRDLNGHGTHVASTVCGATVGVAKKATCIAVKVMKDSGLGTVFDITDGVSWVAEQHTKGNGTARSVANMSLGSPISNPIIDASVAALARSGVIVVVAAGNSDRDACNGSPAGQPDMITVGAADSNDVRASFSNWGACLDLFAPGVNITAAWWEANDQYFVASGTSMASPHVCGLAALILAEQQPGFSQEEMRSVLVKTATPDLLSDPKESPNLIAFTSPPPASL